MKTIYSLQGVCLLVAGTLLGGTAPVRPEVMQSYGRLPLSFEANQGQADPQVKFMSRGSGGSFFLTSREAVLVLAKPVARERSQERLPAPRQDYTGPAAVVRMRLVGANPAAQISGAEELPGKSNYFIGKDPAKWRTNVPNYGRVRYREVYPGIDLVYYGNQRQVEHDFVVAPGADPSRIRLSVRGVERLRVEENGDLRMRAGDREVRLLKPVIYQEAQGRREAVAGRYLLTGRQSFGFVVAGYDRRRELVIDPVLVYSTYVGGSGYDVGLAIAADSSGNVYITGYCDLSYPVEFPTTGGAFRALSSGSTGAVFVTKLNASGNDLIYSAILGGGYGYGIAVDSSGSAYITGMAEGYFPTTSGAFQTVLGGRADAFVTKLSATGSELVYSTLLGGSVSVSWGGGTVEGGYRIAVDLSGNAYIAGYTDSPDFPTTVGAFQRAVVIGGRTGFVAKLNATGSGLAYSTYLSSTDYSIQGIAVDASGSAYVTGFTESTTFPTTNGAFQPTPPPPMPYSLGNAFVTKFNATGSGLIYSTYLGGSNGDGANAIAIDSSGNAYVTGRTLSTDFPTTSGAYRRANVGGDVFITELNSAGSGLVYSTYLGGSHEDDVLAIALDSSGNTFITGRTYSKDFPITSDAFQNAFGGLEDAFVAKLNSAGSGLVYSTYLGGSDREFGIGIALDSSGNAIVIGPSWSSDFPTTSGAFQRAKGGTLNPDAFVVKISFRPGPHTTASLEGPAGTNGWYIGPVAVTLTATDPLSSVAATHYNLDNGPNFTYSSPFPVSIAGVHQLSFYSTDLAGNQEQPNQLTVKIDPTNPTSAVLALAPSQTTYSFPVRWQGTDAGSGLQDFSIYVSDSGGPFVSWLRQTTSTQAIFAGTAGHRYSFFSLARDTAGNLESTKTIGEASTTVTICASNVSSQLSVSRGGFRYDNGTKQFTQTVTLRNNGSSTLSGPVSLVLDSLVSAATLSNRSGVTACAGPLGSPFVNAGFNSLTPGQSGQINLSFANPTNAGITYATRVLTGAGAR